MPYTRPNPDREPGGKPAASGKPSGLFGAWVQAEKLMQIALVLPSAAFIGWVGGAWLDRWLHQSWIGIAGIVFGGVSGLVYVVRLALAAGNSQETGEEAAGQSGKAGGGDRS
jgi:Putative F0F1-ATPase subunit Ca2+/Mg2+ transporter